MTIEVGSAFPQTSPIVALEGVLACVGAHNVTTIAVGQSISIAAEFCPDRVYVLPVNMNLPLLAKSRYYPRESTMANKVW